MIDVIGWLFTFFCFIISTLSTSCGTCLILLVNRLMLACVRLRVSSNHSLCSLCLYTTRNNKLIVNVSAFCILVPFLFLSRRLNNVRFGFDFTLWDVDIVIHFPCHRAVLPPWCYVNYAGNWSLRLFFTNFSCVLNFTLTWLFWELVWHKIITNYLIKVWWHDVEVFGWRLVFRSSDGCDISLLISFKFNLH